MSLWQTLARLHPPDAAERVQAEDLLKEFHAAAGIPRTCRAMLSYSDGTLIEFYRQLSETRSTGSPVKDHADSGWMADADFCFVNVRAAGLQEEPGTLIQAAKLLPALHANAIHLGPFTDYDFHAIYAVRSVRSISPLIVDPNIHLTAEDQLRALVEAAHLLGKAVGFDLEPHMAQFAMPVLQQPELFRWIKLAPDRNALENGLSTGEMLDEGQQQRITAEIRGLVAGVLQAAGLADLEVAPDDEVERRALKQRTYFNLIGVLIERGYWTIPSQSWAGAGVPAFDGYNHAHHFARFAYRGPHGEDLSASAFHILTPIKFTTGLRTNQVADTAPYEPGIQYFCDIFRHWRDEFDFDFVRYDSADHIFDSIVAGGEDRPASDRPTPAVLRRCVEASRAGRPSIGNFAERMGLELDDYAALGFDLILGVDMLRRIDRAAIESMFRLHDQLWALNADRRRRFAVPFCVDTHDTGNPVFWKEPLVKAVGAESMRLRHFVARFGSCGLARRPKYEVMGSQDLSYGLYASNIADQNLVWVGDEAYNRRYHRLEEVYEHYRSLLAQGVLEQTYVDDDLAWWIISGEDRRLIAVIALEPVQPDRVLEVGVALPGTSSAWRVREPSFTADHIDDFSLTGTRLQVAVSTQRPFRLFEVQPIT